MTTTTSSTSETKAKHPAPFTPAIIDYILEQTDGRRGTFFDPFAGIGQQLARFKAPGRRVVGYEIEQPWAEIGAPLVRHGDSTRTHFRRGSVATMVTSVCYGNRFADSHDAQERCRVCGGTGEIKAPGSTQRAHVAPCSACAGEGRRHHTRRGYTHDIREQTGDRAYRLADNNAGKMHYGPAYQDLHRAVYRELGRIARPATVEAGDDGCHFWLNVSDFYKKERKGEPTRRVAVAAWHAATLCAMGWELVGGQIIATPRMKYGANGDMRVDGEWVFEFRRPVA